LPLNYHLVKTKRTLTQNAFDHLLAWLDEDRERAGEKYESIRQKLVKIFTARGCMAAEELADETIDRVARRVPEIAAAYKGERALYFYGVAQKVHLEYLKRKPPPPLPPPAAEAQETEEEYECLEECIEALGPSARELILRYYTEDRQAKIDERRRLAEELGIGLNALRIRAHRIRASLEQCVTQCLGLKREGLK
jgi:DNA-directed RNA polymerase specialized sigma24 family protein